MTPKQILAAHHALFRDIPHGSSPGGDCDTCVLLTALREAQGEIEARAAELLMLRANADRPKCFYCCFGETGEPATFEALQQHIESECEHHPIRHLKAQLAERDAMTLSVHDHGNCALCDEIERQLAERERQLAAAQEVVRRRLFRCTCFAYLDGMKCQRCDLLAALSPEEAP